MLVLLEIKHGLQDVKLHGGGQRVDVRAEEVPEVGEIQ